MLALLPCIVVGLNFLITATDGWNKWAVGVGLGTTTLRPSPTPPVICAPDIKIVHVTAVRGGDERSPVITCTGLVLKPNFILTAAVCTGEVTGRLPTNIPSFAITARILEPRSEFNRVRDLRVLQRANVTKQFVHPHWNISYTTNNLAILMVEPEFELEGHTMAAFLDERKLQPTEKEFFKLKFNGYGYKPNDNFFDVILTEYSVTRYGCPVPIEGAKGQQNDTDWTQFICTPARSFEDESKYLCKEDIGGPLYQCEPVSKTKFCCSVFGLLTWIYEVDNPFCTRVCFNPAKEKTRLLPCTRNNTYYKFTIITGELRNWVFNTLYLNTQMDLSSTSQCSSTLTRRKTVSPSWEVTDHYYELEIYRKEMDSMVPNGRTCQSKGRSTLLPAAGVRLVLGFLLVVSLWSVRWLR